MITRGGADKTTDLLLLVIIAIFPAARNPNIWLALRWFQGRKPLRAEIIS